MHMHIIAVLSIGITITVVAGNK